MVSSTPQKYCATLSVYSPAFSQGIPGGRGIYSIILILYLFFAAPAYATFENSENSVQSVKSTTSATTSAGFLNINPEFFFQRIRDAITLKTFLMPDLYPKIALQDAFGDYNRKIKDATGIDIIKFFCFIGDFAHTIFSLLASMLGTTMKK